MAKTKNYKEELEGFESGLKQLENMKPNKFKAYERIKQLKEIQYARIDSFKFGYSLRDIEIKEQQKIKLDAKIDMAKTLNGIELKEQNKLFPKKVKK